MRLGLHLEKFPTGRYGYVGSVPVLLHRLVPAERSDIMAQRTTRDPRTGELLGLRPMTFDTAAQALAAVRRLEWSAGPLLCDQEHCACAKVRKEAEHG